jgi:2,4-dienoyl-CoA reductase-like NADH-dependent reductase (Old Yellow Enzyme family)
MMLQLWHVGRISDPSFLDGKPPVAPSAIAAKQHVSLLRPLRPYPIPRAMEASEIPAVIEAFRRGAENAQRAGFDEVEIHGANGYLLDQFLQDSTSHRDDGYGGPVENRARLMLEVTDAVASVWGADRVGMHLAPRGHMYDMGSSDPAETFGYAARELGRRRIAFLFAREHAEAPRIGPMLKREFDGTFIANERFTLQRSQRDLDRGDADAVSFGLRFIANADLVYRLATGSALNDLDPDTMYGGGARGYTDYQALERNAA